MVIASNTADHYALWWPHHVAGTVRELDAAGKVVKSMTTSSLDPPTKP